MDDYSAILKGTPTPESGADGSASTPSSGADDYSAILNTGTPSQSRGFVGETAAGFKRGGLQLVDMMGNIARAVDPAGGVDVVRNLGFKASKFAKERAKQSDVAESSYTTEHPILGNIPKAAEMIIPSVGIPLAIGTGAAVAGVSAPVATAAGIIGAGTAFGLSQFQDTKERGIEKGLTEEQATTAGIKTGLSEGGLEAVSNIIPAAKLFKLGKPVAGQVVKSLFGAPSIKAAAKTLVNDAAHIMTGEVSTEMAQAYTQGLTEKNAGIRPDADPWQEAKDVIGPTIALSLMLGGAVGGVNKLSKIATQRAIQNAGVSPDVRTQAASAVYNGLLAAEEEGTAPAGSADNFMSHAALAIKDGKPLTLSDDLLKPQTSHVEVAPEEAAANILDKFTQGLSPSEAIEEHNAEVAEHKITTDLKADIAKQIEELASQPEKTFEDVLTDVPADEPGMVQPTLFDPATGEVVDTPVISDPLDALKGYPNKEAAVKELKRTGRMDTHTTQERADGQTVIVPKVESKAQIVPEVQGDVVAPPVKKVTMGGVTAEITPEQQKEWDRIDAEHNARVAVYQGRPDQSTTEKDIKGSAMRAAAEKRAAAPQFMTAKEKEAAAKREASNYNGKEVSHAGQPAVVIGGGFGKVKIRLADGTEKSVPKDEIGPKVELAPETPIPAAAPAPVETPAPETPKPVKAKKSNKAKIEVAAPAVEPIAEQAKAPKYTEEEKQQFLNGLPSEYRDAKGQAALMGKVEERLATLADEVDYEGVDSEAGIKAQEQIDQLNQTKAMLESLKSESIKLSSAEGVAGVDNTVPAVRATAVVGEGVPQELVASKGGATVTAVLAVPDGVLGGLPQIAKALFGKVVYTYPANSSASFGLAFVDTSRPDVIFIREDAQRPAMFLFGHETTHLLKAENPELYKELVALLDEHTDLAKAYYQRQHLSTIPEYSNLSREGVAEEFAGDIVGGAFGRQSFWDAMAQKNPSLFAKVYQILRGMVDKALSIVRGSRFDKASQTLKDIEAADKALAQIFTKYSKEKGNDPAILTTRILAQAAAEHSGSRLGDATAELERLVGASIYDRKVTSPRARKTVEAKVLRAWAKAQGILSDGKAFDKEWNKQTNADGKRIRGNEHDVIFNGDGTVTKRNHLPGTYHLSYRELFDRVALFNYLFGEESALTLTGFQDTADGLLPEFTQKDLGGTPARIEQVEKMLEDAGFKSVLDDNKTLAYKLPGTDIILTDVFGENTRQIGETSVPMDYVIFHGDRAKEWLDAQLKAPFENLQTEAEIEAEVNAAFDSAVGDTIKLSAVSDITSAAKSALALNTMFKGRDVKNMLNDVLTGAMRYIMPTDRTIGMAVTQENYKTIAPLLNRYRQQRQEKAGHVQAQMNDAQAAVNLINKAFKTDADMKALSDLVFRATDMQLHADGAVAWTEAEWEKAGMLEKFGPLKAAQASLTAQYNKLSTEQKTAHDAMLTQLKKVYLEGRDAALAPWKTAMPDLYKQAEAYNKTQNEAVSQEVKDLAATINHIESQYPQLKGDYMPFMRFGQFVVRTMEMDEQGDTGNRVRTEFFDSQAEALEYVERINANDSNGMHAELESSKSLGERGVVNIPAAMIDKLKTAAENRGISGDALTQLVADAEALRINMMPRTASAGNKLKREGVEGYSTNVLKVFSNYVKNHANANAGLIYGSKIEQTFRDMGNQIKEYRSTKGYDPKAALDMDVLYKQLYENEKTSQRVKLNEFTKAVGKLSFAWYLTSPSIWAVQWSQPFMVTIPKMAAKYGYKAAFKAYTEAASRYLHGDFSDEKINAFNRDHEFVGDRIYDLIQQSREDNANKKQLDAKIKAIFDQYTDPKEKRLVMLKVLSLQGRIDLSASHNLQDLAAASNRGDRLTDKAGELGDTIMKKGAFFMQHSETGSRRAAAVSSFEMMLKSSGSFIEANDYASEIINDTLFDFDSANRGKAWQGNTGHILGQFQFFRLHMLGKMLQLTKDAIGGEYKASSAAAIKSMHKLKYNVSEVTRNGETQFAASKDGKTYTSIDDVKTLPPEVAQYFKSRSDALTKRTEARKEVAYMMGTSLALAGAGGTPLALAFGNTLTSALWGALSFMFGDDDDDDPIDMKREFELAVREALGDTAGNVLLKGLPTLVGMDISQRIGLGNIGDVVMGDPPAGAGPTAKANWYAGRLLGPAWGMVADTMRAGDELAKGDLAKAVQYSSPKVLRDFIKMTETASHGIQGGGKTLLQPDDVSAYSMALMMVGINPSEVSLATEESRYLKNLSTSISRKRSGLIQDLASATADSDFDKKQEAIEKINSWSEKNPKLKITAQELTTGIKREQGKRAGTLTKKEMMLKDQYGMKGGE